jgi:ArsR family transcriptional regulator
MDRPARHPVLDQLAAAADALRGRLLLVLDGQELTVSELCDILQLPQSTVSRHLKTLLDSGWIVSRREATSRYYRLEPDDLAVATRRVWLVLRDDLAATPAAEQDDRRLKRALARRRTASEEFFSSAAGEWDRVRDELFGASSHLRLPAALLDPRWVVGDLGCGTGHVTEAIAPFVARVVAVDASREMLGAARTRLRGHDNVELRRGTLERLPIEDASLDAAILALVLHHVPDPARVCAEAARVLRPGGRFVLADMLPHEHDEYRQTMGHVWMGFAPRQVEKMLAGGGFEAARVRALEPERGVKGPALFVATATRGVTVPERAEAEEDPQDARPAGVGAAP